MVSSSGEFRSFLIQTLIRKDNTDNKVFKKEFYTKETIKKGIEKKFLQILVQFTEIIRESVRETRFFEFEYFLFF